MGIAIGLRRLGIATIFMGKFGEAEELLEKSKALYVDLGSLNEVTYVDMQLVMLKQHLGQYEEARDRRAELAARAQQQSDAACTAKKARGAR